jgi:APA family basic amino acid/polyamine antiporter
MLVPKKLPEAWNNRYIKVSNGVFLGLMTVSLIAALGCIILTMNTIKPVQVVLSVALPAIFLIYSMIRKKMGCVKMEKSYELN